MNSDWDKYVKIWIQHSFFYSFTFTLASTLYQAYAIRILKFDVDELGNAVFINLATIALGNLIAVPLLQRYRRRRIVIWKIFTTINIVSWALTGFTDLLQKHAFLLFLALAQFTGAVGGLAYSDTIADLIPKERSIKVFSRASVYTVTASLLSLVISFTIFSYLGFTSTSYRVNYVLSLASAIISSSFLWFMKDLVKRENNKVTFKYLASMYRNIITDNKCKHYILSLTLFTFFVNIPGALWNYYIIKIYNGNELWISVNTIASTLATTIGNYILSNISHKLNPKKTVVYSSIFISFVPIFFLISPTFESQALLNLYSGFSWAGFNLMLNIYNLYLAGENRIYLIAILGILNNLGAAIASRLGATISTLGLTAMQCVFLASGLGRLATYIYMRRKLPEV